MIRILRNGFLGTASFLCAPNDPPGADAKDQGAGGDDPAEDTGAAGEGGDDDPAGGDEDPAGGEGGDDDPAGGDEEDDDPDLADLPPEVRAKAKAAIDKKLAREIGWRDRQIDKLHARRRAAEEDARTMETIADPARRTPPAAGTSDPNRKFTQEEVKTEAQRIAAQTKYENDANDADARGVSAYGVKWKSTLAKLPKLGGVDITDMVDILNTDQPHVVLFQLSDPETYQRVMDLPPARRRNEFVKLSLKEAPKPKLAAVESKKPSGAPAPVDQVRGGRRVAAQSVDIFNDKTEDDAWYAARNATRRKKFSDAV